VSHINCSTAVLAHKTKQMYSTDLTLTQWLISL